MFYVSKDAVLDVKGSYQTIHSKNLGLYFVILRCKLKMT